MNKEKQKLEQLTKVIDNMEKVIINLSDAANKKDVTYEDMLVANTTAIAEISESVASMAEVIVTLYADVLRQDKKLPEVDDRTGSIVAW